MKIVLKQFLPPKSINSEPNISSEFSDLTKFSKDIFNGSQNSEWNDFRFFLDFIKIKHFVNQK